MIFVCSKCKHIHTMLIFRFHDFKLAIQHLISGSPDIWEKRVVHIGFWNHKMPQGRGSKCSAYEQRGWGRWKKCATTHPWKSLLAGMSHGSYEKGFLLTRWKALQLIDMIWKVMSYDEYALPETTVTVRPWFHGWLGSPILSIWEFAFFSETNCQF